MLLSGKIPSYVECEILAWVPYLLRFASICHYLPVFATIRTIRDYLLYSYYSLLGTIRCSQVATIRYSGFPDTQAPAARRAAKQSHILIWERKETHQAWVNFLVVIMASRIAHGRVRTTTTTAELPKMAAILQMIGWQRHAALVYRVFLWYWTSTLWSINTCQNKTRYPQTSITWPHRGLKYIVQWRINLC